MGRQSENNIEQMRKDIKKDVKRQVKANPSYKIARFVDQPVLEKTVLSQYGQFKSAMRKADTEGIEKARSTYGASVVGGKLMASEVPADLSIENLYFNTYGHGFYGKNPDPMHQTYVCPKCGCKMLMDLGIMDSECPRCRYPTPIGQLVKDGLHLRW